jgi:hypothetical protein
LVQLSFLQYFLLEQVLLELLLGNLQAFLLAYHLAFLQHLLLNII